jgi:hypothetical protein
VIRDATSGRQRTWGGGPAVDYRLYKAAVSRGIDVTGWSAEVEQADRPVRILATATVHTPSLLVAVAAGSEQWGSARSLSAGLVRLAHHALEVHARDTGYDAEPWIAQTITLAGLHAYEQDDDPERVVECQREAAEHLSDAIVALSSDRMAFADCLTNAQAGWLSCFRRARNGETRGCRRTR